MFVGRRLAKLREEKDIGQKELAAVLGVKRNTISDYENNTLNPSMKVIINIARYFEVSLDYLMGLTDDIVSYDHKDMILLPKDFPKEAIPKVKDYIHLIETEHKAKKSNTRL